MTSSDAATAAIAATTEDAVNRLIENGTFGTAGARSLASRTPDEIARTVTDRAASNSANSAVVDCGIDTATSTGRRSHRSSWETANRTAEGDAADVPDDADLASVVAAAREGDPRATNALLTRIRPLIVRYCRVRVGRQAPGPADAADLAQEICLAVLSALPSYTDQGRPFLAFVFGIAAHKVAAAHSTARYQTEPVAQVPATPEPHPQATIRAEMTRLLNALPMKQREILVLRIVLGLSAEETAEAIGITPSAVRAAQRRALARLHSQFEQPDTKLRT